MAQETRCGSVKLDQETSEEQAAIVTVTYGVGQNSLIIVPSTVGVVLMVDIFRLRI